MTIEANVRHSHGAFHLAVDLSFGGKVLGVLGPSGSGKTTLLDIVAGLVTPDEGRLSVGGRVFVDRAAGVCVPIHKRRVGYVFQDGRLLPHLSVRRNLRFGRWFGGARTPRFDEGAIVALLDIAPLLDRSPGGLSGGERQRVGIGRALMADPDLLLMDEPLSALDDARRQEVLPFIERVRDTLDVPIAYVSHAEDEVERLADVVVRLDRGRIVERTTLARRPWVPHVFAGSLAAT